MLSAVESLLEGSGRKAEVISSIKDVQMSPNAIKEQNQFHIILVVN
jgi:hypothetical protein